jgi:uncharacterized protein (DUF2236 family)
MHRASAEAPFIGFSPGQSASASMAWRLHREVVLLAGWGRAILLQVAHPLVARGVADHSPFAAEPWGRVKRLERTLRAMLTLTFGTPGEIAAVAAHINRVHDGIHGRLGEGAGAFDRGASYSAHDPALLAWVHATLLDSFLLTYERFVAPLTPAERDRYCREASAGASLLGIPPGRSPQSAAQLAAYMKRMLEGGDIAVTAAAREIAREVLAPPAPWPARPLLALARLPAIGLLPPAVRSAYGFAWTPRRDRALRLLAAVVRGALPLAPSALRYWPAARAAAARERQTGVIG